jgi:ABC-type multidrug transport system ATPase subunit
LFFLKGDAFIFGNSVTADMHKINEMIGVCPQFDILWPDLTAREHLEIMKNLKLSTRNADVDATLRDVRLLSVANDLSQTFSGGMKRYKALLIL